MEIQKKRNQNKVINTSTCLRCGKGNHDFVTRKYRRYKVKILKKVEYLANIC